MTEDCQYLSLPLKYPSCAAKPGDDVNRNANARFLVCGNQVPLGNAWGTLLNVVQSCVVSYCKAPQRVKFAKQCDCPFSHNLTPLNVVSLFQHEPLMKSPAKSFVGVSGAPCSTVCRRRNSKIPAVNVDNGVPTKSLAREHIIMSTATRVWLLMSSIYASLAYLTTVLPRSSWGVSSLNTNKGRPGSMRRKVVDRFVSFNSYWGANVAKSPRRMCTQSKPPS